MQSRRHAVEILSDRKNNEKITQLTLLMPVWGLALRPLSGVRLAKSAQPEVGNDR
jgi:hypothetical protein